MSIIVKKKIGDNNKQKLRVCVDFRKLNEVTKNEAYCLSNLLDIEKSKTTPWHPQTNGFLERSHKTMIRLLLGIQLAMAQLHYQDNQIRQKSGIYYENLGPIKIVTNTWGLAIYLDTSCYVEQWTVFEDRLEKIRRMCTEITKWEDLPNCEPMLTHATLMKKKLYECRELLLGSVETRARRGIWQRYTGGTAVTKSKELYSTYDNFNPTICKTAHEFLICPETHPLHPRSMRPVCEILLMQEPREVPESCEIRYVEMATTVFHKLRHKNEWLYVTNNDSVFVTCEEDKESKNHILEGVGIIALNESCRGYAKRDVLIPGRVAGRTQYTDFIPTSELKEPNNDSGNDYFIKTMKFHHVKTNQMSDLNDITITQEQAVEQLQQKLLYQQIESKMYVVAVIGITTIIVILIISCALSLSLKFVTNKTGRNPYEEPLQLEEKWTQVNTNDLLEATSPSERSLATIPEEVIETTFSLYPKLKT
ncbi:hypothetical protein AGLY_006426 [Aphis glycines]|uniref:Integrase catalytic domain-containing protein n=1 Tax=Aphis glycines TaxID=307491 RepID=A0A6G0TR77_APHGL|nr:hypothetical protein AGLY_006426 [Aphis glycines]